MTFLPYPSFSVKEDAERGSLIKKKKKSGSSKAVSGCFQPDSCVQLLFSFFFAKVCVQFFFFCAPVWVVFFFSPCQQSFFFFLLLTDSAHEGKTVQVVVVVKTKRAFFSPFSLSNLTFRAKTLSSSSFFLFWLLSHYRLGISSRVLFFTISVLITVHPLASFLF